MKRKLIALSFLIILVSCLQRNEKKNTSTSAIDTLKTKIVKKEKERLENRKKNLEENKRDSLELDKILKQAVKISTQNITKSKFHKEYEIKTNNEYIVKVEINLENHFTKFYPHLIIRRRGPNTVYIDIYSKNKATFKKVLSHDQWALTYVNDTIRDINGDGLNDFVVNWYGASGCCLKAFSNIYLLRQDRKSFSRNFEFINPTFSPKERIIRGVCYGHPGENEMYKYKWNKETVDTLEYISYEKNKKGVKTGKIIITKKIPRGNKYEITKRINAVPNEYKKVDGFDWFTGKLL